MAPDGGRRLTLRVLFAAAELAPLSKVGGLGDVAAALPEALARAGAEVTIVTPLHTVVRQKAALEGLPTRTLSYTFGGRSRTARLIETRVPGGSVPVHLLEDPALFETGPEVYGRETGPDGVGDLRWFAFSAALREVTRALDLRPQILHLHDWHTALAAVLWRTDHAFDEEAAGTACVLTLHNVAYQGQCSPADWRRTGLRDDLLNDWCLLSQGEVNPLKAGILFAERITTVSPGYAQEILGSEGRGLTAVLESRQDDLEGILNALDPQAWDPATDENLAQTYDAKNLEGRRASKRALAAELELNAPEGPLVAYVGRLTEQKG
ncbi:MAG: glycogen/starch synthase, partial [Planctomycetes bacterium]|nr:glycogen/starch synthase [Planctomycetota bacterium]